MSRSGEKHAQDYNLILCILMALRATYFLSVIYGDPVSTTLYRTPVLMWHGQPPLQRYWLRTLEADFDYLSIYKLTN